MTAKYRFTQDNFEETFEDTNYLRYAEFYGDLQVQPQVSSDEWDSDELLDDDALSAAEAGFMQGYSRRGQSKRYY